MGTVAQVSVEEYLHTVYEPDCDYVDGELEDRNVGERDHSYIQIFLGAYFHARRKELNLYAFVEQRVQVKPTRFRVPDICVTLGPMPKDQIFKDPPFLCIEILSPEDRVERMQRKIFDYLDIGVKYVWLISPNTRTAWIYTPERTVEVKDGVLRTAEPEIAVPLAEIFEEL